MAEAKKPGILVVGVIWPPETFLANLLQGLLQAGLRLTLATSRKPDPAWLALPGFTWLHLPTWKGSPAGKLARLTRSAARGVLHGRGDLRAFSRHIRQARRLDDRLELWSRLLPFAGRRWGAIYFPWNSAAIEYSPLFDLGMPVVISCRGSQINVAPHNPERNPFRQGLRETFARASAVHCVSEAILNEAIQYGLDPAKARVIYPAVDPEIFRPAYCDRPENPVYRIVTTGSLVWVKGHDYACGAVRQLKDLGIPIHFEIVGSGPERQRFFYTIHDLKLQDCIQLSGRLPPAEVRQRLQNADVFLLSSLSEGLSNAGLEAMACGLPVVTTDCGGMREAVQDGVEGLLTPVRDAAALAAALESLWRDPSQRTRLGAAGRLRVLRDFTLPAQVAQFVELFTSFMSAVRPLPRLVLVVPNFPKLSETFIINKFLGLLTRGWDIHIVCWASDRATWKVLPQFKKNREYQHRVHVVWPHRPRLLAWMLLPIVLLRCLLLSPVASLRYLRLGWRRFGANVLRQLYLDSELILLRPNTLHFEFGSLAPERMYLGNLLDCKVVVSFRGYDLNYIGLDQPGYYQAVWEQADALHLLGQDLWQRAQRRGCPAEKRHVLIPPAIDTDEFSPEDRDADDGFERPLKILSVGRLEWKKGYEYGLQSVRLLMDRGISCEYHILGDGSYLEAVAFALHQLGLEQAVRLLGAQPHDEVREQMAWADVFLHAAVSEGFCNAVIEAQAMRLPVVCSDADGLPENVADGETGFVVPRRDPQALADKLALLAGDPDLRQRMGRAGRERALRCFHLDEQIAAFEQLYRELAL